MAREIYRLTARTVQTIKAPGRYADGACLYLYVERSGSRHWVVRFEWRGKRREMGLGAVAVVSLAEARIKAQDARRLAMNGVDPIAAREITGVPTFGALAHEFVDAQAPSWRGAKTVSGWRRTIDLHAKGIRDRPVDEIETADVLKTLRPYWTAKPESAGKLRERIERVLDVARAKGFRTGDNPARWRGHLDLMLPRLQRLSRGHFAAVPYQDVPAVMASLYTRHGMSARALEWTILSASRESMTLGALWSEISGDLWTVPASRMKDGREHRVPITAPMAEILERVGVMGRDGLVFPSQRGGPMSNMAMDMLVRRIAPGFTVHGFRSSFKDWAAEQTDVADEISEMALAHVVGSTARRSYARGDALDRRRRLMEEWAAFTRPPAAPQAPPDE